MKVNETMKTHCSCEVGLRLQEVTTPPYSVVTGQPPMSEFTPITLYQPDKVLTIQFSNADTSTSPCWAFGTKMV